MCDVQLRKKQAKNKRHKLIYTHLSCATMRDDGIWNCLKAKSCGKYKQSENLFASWLPLIEWTMFISPNTFSCFDSNDLTCELSSSFYFQICWTLSSTIAIYRSAIGIFRSLNGWTLWMASICVWCSFRSFFGQNK